jgi:ubiquinone/menaquinone biosynthesis C-methylase UbiE
LAAWTEKRRVMQAYDVTAEMYDERYCEEQKRKYQKALENVNVGGAAVLDVGCGSGLFFQEIADKARLIIGIDLSKGLLLKAKRHVRENVFVLQADADHLPFVNGFFDAVFSFTVLQNIPKPSKTLLELTRVTRYSGKIVLSGLKKAFGFQKFMDLVENSGLSLEFFVDEDAINCYIAVLNTLYLVTGRQDSE